MFREIGVSPLTLDSVCGTLKLFSDFIVPLISTASGVGASGAVAFPTSSRLGASPLFGFPYDLIVRPIAARENRPIGRHPCLHRVVVEARIIKFLNFLRNSGPGTREFPLTHIRAASAQQLGEIPSCRFARRVAHAFAQSNVNPTCDRLPIQRASRIPAISPYDVRWVSPALERCCEHRTLLVRAKQERSPESDVH
ncbi:hypothetical protein SAMN02927923_03336 [Microvirga guangxiensis]|uniref:Uncharacterized protein n=1 Tax=Microvirga guangxiensis TaxID=549386 RepID=A0A1G5KHY2_9HYPH|nr:hypothetical protein SAMN02927923_03336 [Microvirga guangxiensis]